MTRRRGHTLPELLVAMTFLAVSAAAVGGTALLGARWTADAAVRQEAVRLASSVLDSVTAAYGQASGAAPGARRLGNLEARWRPETTSDPVLIRVDVLSPTGATLATLWGVPRPEVPVLSDTGAPVGGGP